MMWGVGGGEWAAMGAGMIVWIVLIVAVVWVVVRVLGRTETSPPAGAWRGPTPTEELRMRFARGEISEEEYRSRLAVLDERTSAP
jgi:putative membrane protein